MSVRWYLACPLSIRHVEELTGEVAQTLQAEHVLSLQWA
jgi:hypothetical protein